MLINKCLHYGYSESLKLIPVEKLELHLLNMYSIMVADTVEPLYNEVLGTMKITLLYQVSHYIRVKKERNIKSWDQQNYLVIRGFCYIRTSYITRFHCISALAF